MYGGQDDFERWRKECHCELVHVSALCEKFRLTFEIRTDGSLAHRGCNDRMNLAVHGRVARGLEIGTRARTGSRADFTPGNQCARTRNVDEEEYGLIRRFGWTGNPSERDCFCPAALKVNRIGIEHVSSGTEVFRDRLQRDFKSNTCGIACSNSEEG